MTDIIEMCVWQNEFSGNTKSAAVIKYDFLKIGRGGEMVPLILFLFLFCILFQFYLFVL